jgi:hypothetical protein
MAEYIRQAEERLAGTTDPAERAIYQNLLDDLRRKQTRALALRRLRQVALALSMYADDYGGVLPPMDTIETAWEALSPYLRIAAEPGAAPWTDPETGSPYRTNPYVGGKVASECRELVAFYVDQPAADGKRGVAVVSGSVWWMPPEQWTEYRANSHIP